MVTKVQTQPAAGQFQVWILGEFQCRDITPVHILMTEIPADLTSTAEFIEAKALNVTYASSNEWLLRVKKGLSSFY